MYKIIICNLFFFPYYGYRRPASSANSIVRLQSTVIKEELLAFEVRATDVLPVGNRRVKPSLREEAHDLMQDEFMRNTNGGGDSEPQAIYHQCVCVCEGVRVSVSLPVPSIHCLIL